VSAHTPFLNLCPSNPLEGLEQWALLFLRARGWVCEIPRQWETPGEFMARLGVNHSQFNRRIHDKRSPLPKDCIHWCSGTNRRRVRALAATKAFETFCLTNRNEQAHQLSTINHQL